MHLPWKWKIFQVSNCKTDEEIMDTLDITYEGMDEVKRSKLNTLSLEFELSRTLPYESILDLQRDLNTLQIT